MTEIEIALIVQEARYGANCPVSGDFDASVRDAIMAGYRAGQRESGAYAVALETAAKQAINCMAENMPLTGTAILQTALERNQMGSESRISEGAPDNARDSAPAMCASEQNGDEEQERRMKATYLRSVAMNGLGGEMQRALREAADYIHSDETRPAR